MSGPLLSGSSSSRPYTDASSTPDYNEGITGEGRKIGLKLLDQTGLSVRAPLIRPEISDCLYLDCVRLTVEEDRVSQCITCPMAQISGASVQCVVITCTGVSCRRLEQGTNKTCLNEKNDDLFSTLTAAHKSKIKISLEKQMESSAYFDESLDEVMAW